MNTRSSVIQAVRGLVQCVYDFARSSGRRLLVFREDPADHWSPGGVLGVATCVPEVAMVDPDHDRPNIEVPR